MLVSVLVDRYQRVYARKLYVNEEPVEFDEPAEVDVQIDETTVPTVEVERALSLPNSSEPSVDDDRDQLYFILGYVTDERDEIDDECFQRIRTILHAKESFGVEFHFYRIANGSSTTKTNGVKFEIASTSSENEQIDDDPFTEIARGCRHRSNVLKTFYRRRLRRCRLNSLEGGDVFLRRRFFLLVQLRLRKDLKSFVRHARRVGVGVDFRLDRLENSFPFGQIRNTKHFFQRILNGDDVLQMNVHVVMPMTRSGENCDLNSKRKLRRRNEETRRRTFRRINV